MSSDIFQITERRARKRHVCCERGCRAEIAPDEKYTIYHGVSDGGGFSEKSCQWCVTVRDWATAWYVERGLLDQWDYEEWPVIGGLWAWLDEMAGPEPQIEALAGGEETSHG